MTRKYGLAGKCVRSDIVVWRATPVDDECPTATDTRNPVFGHGITDAQNMGNMVVLLSLLSVLLFVVVESASVLCNLRVHVCLRA